jgi:hypothetical protein
MGMSKIQKRALKGGVVLPDLTALPVHAPPDLTTLPVRTPRDTAAALVSKYYFKISPRTLERWPLTWRRLNGKAHCETAELFAHAELMLAEAPPVMGGHAGQQKST